MAKEATTEIMMQFVGSDNQAIVAECPTSISDSDELANKDVPGYAKKFSPGRYFLVDSFRFGLTLNDSESSGRQSSGAPAAATSFTSGGRPDPRAPAALTAKLQPTPPAAAGHGLPLAGLHNLSHADLLKLLKKQANSSRDKFMRWRSASKWDQTTADAMPYNAKVDEFSFTRRMDLASTELFVHCFKQQTFPFASLVKRKSAPVVLTEDPQNQSYLRIDFADVQISSLQWSDDDVMQESCSFRARSVQIQYWTQTDQPSADTDSFLKSLNSARWDNKAGDPGDGT